MDPWLRMALLSSGWFPLRAQPARRSRWEGAWQPPRKATRVARDSSDTFGGNSRQREHEHGQYEEGEIEALPHYRPQAARAADAPASAVYVGR